MAWTTDKQNWLKDMLDSPNGQEFIAILKEKCRVPGEPVVVIPGVDIKEVASQGYAHAQGQSSVFLEIEKLKPTNLPKPLGQPFQTTPPPKPE